KRHGAAARQGAPRPYADVPASRSNRYSKTACYARRRTIPMENPTVVFTEPGKVVIEDRPKPPPNRGQLLIRTRRSLISTGTELTILSGDYPPDSHWSRYGKLPFVAGYSNVGEVIDVGAEVDAAWIGKRV